MKTLRRIKLNSLSQEDLADREMNALRGGIPVDVLVSKEQNLKLLTIVLMLRMISILLKVILFATG